MSDNNNNVANDELVSQFMAFTGSSDAERACSYLEMSGNDLQTAIGLYMEHEHQGPSGDSAGDALHNNPPAEIRAPDATRTMRLMDEHEHDMGGFGYQDPTMQLMNAMMDEQLFAGAFANADAPIRGNVRAAINAAAAEEKSNDEDDDEDEDDDSVIMADDYQDLAQQQPAQPPRLSDMFAAPTHLMHTTGGFQGARASAKDARRWLLVNIQCDSEFSCHSLNRDVWKDELVENLVREGFIFWQAVSTA
jgi:hypothetical protein